MKGKLSKTELINECSRLVRLEPTEEDKKKIKQEEIQLLEDVDKDMKLLENDENS